MEKDYIFLESTTSICTECLEKIDAKIIRKGNGIFVRKLCPKHGVKDEILEENSKYYYKKLFYYKTGTPSKIQTDFKKGCPRDCGICPNHEQHTCIGLIEITNKCNLGCPTCYANSLEGDFLNLETIEKMMNFYQDSEFNKAEILQISGGEPTIHPDILKIIEIAKTKKFKYVMLNTNGIKIAEDEQFVKELSKFKGGFEVYLQFDSLNDRVYKKLRGKELLKIKKKAISNLQKYKIPITLVSTIENQVNDNEIWDIIDFGIKEKHVRGVNFQPVAFFGRGNFNTQNRITLSGIIDRVEKQSKSFLKFDDFSPLPCDPDRVALLYLHNKNNKWNPILSNINIPEKLDNIKNTFAFNLDDILQKNSNSGCNGSCSPWQGITKVIEPKLMLMNKEEQSEYIDNNFFRISIKSFIDIYNFDIKSVQKDCVHIITPNLKKIPFSTYNMFYRK